MPLALDDPVLCYNYTRFGNELKKYIYYRKNIWPLINWFLVCRILRRLFAHWFCDILSEISQFEPTLSAFLSWHQFGKWQPLAPEKPYSWYTEGRSVYSVITSRDAISQPKNQRNTIKLLLMIEEIFSCTINFKAFLWIFNTGIEFDIPFIRSTTARFSSIWKQIIWTRFIDRLS